MHGLRACPPSPMAVDSATKLGPWGGRRGKGRGGEWRGSGMVPRRQCASFSRPVAPCKSQVPPATAQLRAHWAGATSPSPIPAFPHPGLRCLQSRKNSLQIGRWAVTAVSRKILPVAELAPQKSLSPPPPPPPPPKKKKPTTAGDIGLRHKLFSHMYCKCALPSHCCAKCRPMKSVRSLAIVARIIQRGTAFVCSISSMIKASIKSQFF